MFQKAIDSASTPAAKANAQRAMAMSYAFDGDCKNTGKYEQLVIDYWTTQEEDQPANAFYQEGEMANEAARVCIDSGDIDAAERWYTKGHCSASRSRTYRPGAGSSGNFAPSTRWRGSLRAGGTRPRRRST